ncbi:XisI protein [Polyangium sp. 15x6]|uniref:XisI protein n=1 Tax=Polyangium sp. 15x6 TaxID=3042687 RepID=UPI00249A6CCA|nr:XisI protein [Polyangium sp. 15x6]MDI3291014.1 XisI protein [Polyangium sp. 15x6]
MDTRAADREVIEKVLSEYAAIPYAHGNVDTVTVFDRESDHYLLMIVGSENRRRVHGCLVHIDRIGDQIWIQADGTERGMAPALVRAGIPAERIMLAFSSEGAYPYSDVLAA